MLAVGSQTNAVLVCRVKGDWSVEESREVTVSAWATAIGTVEEKEFLVGLRNGEIIKIDEKVGKGGRRGEVKGEVGGEGAGVQGTHEWNSEDCCPGERKFCIE